MIYTMKSLRHHLLSDQKHPSRPLLVWPPLPSLKLARLKFKKQRESINHQKHTQVLLQWKTTHLDTYVHTYKAYASMHDIHLIYVPKVEPSNLITERLRGCWGILWYAKLFLISSRGEIDEIEWDERRERSLSDFVHNSCGSQVCNISDGETLQLKLMNKCWWLVWYNQLRS